MTCSCCRCHWCRDVRWRLQLHELHQTVALWTGALHIAGPKEIFQLNLLKKEKFNVWWAKTSINTFVLTSHFTRTLRMDEMFFDKRTWSLFEGTTVDTEGGVLVEEGVEEPRRAELATWTTLVTVMVCLILFAADCLVTTVPSDGNWFSWFKTNVVVDGWGLCCWRH